MQTDSCFVDSNIWLYSFINTEPRKYNIAVELIENENITLSYQIINEVSYNLVRKGGFKDDQIYKLIDSFMNRYYVVGFDEQLLKKATRLRSAYKISFWDSLIVASALKTGSNTLYSEDMHHGLIVENSLTIINPFR